MTDDTGMPNDPFTGDMPGDAASTPPGEPTTPTEASFPIQSSMPAPDWAVPAPPARKSPLRFVTAVVGILAIAGGAVFAATSLGKNAGGGSTPEAATRNFLSAIANEDLLGAMGTLLPGERDALRRPLTDMTAQLARLGVLKDGATLSKVSGLDVGFKDLTFTTKTLDSGHAVVSLTGGTGSIKFDPAALPLGPFLTDKIGTSLKGGERSLSGPITPSNDTKFATVRDGGKWYVSLTFSIAESARENAGAPVPDFSKRIQARGESTPERATEAFLRALTTYDFETAIALLPPDEMRALQEYAPFYLDQAKGFAAVARRNLGIDISALDLSSTKNGDEALVRIKHVEFKALAPDGHIGIAYDGNCLTTKGLPGGFPPQVCSKDLLQQSGIPGAKAPNLGFVCVQRGGQWFVSPIRTTLDGITAILKGLEKKDLDRIGSMLGGIVGGAASATYSMEASPSAG